MMSTQRWDQPRNLKGGLTKNWAARPAIAALIADLQSRRSAGRNADRLGGELVDPARTEDDGRDHKPPASACSAGARESGLRYGATDEHGIAAVENKVMSRLHARCCNLLGLDTEAHLRYSGAFPPEPTLRRVVNEIYAYFRSVTRTKPGTFPGLFSFRAPIG